MTTKDVYKITEQYFIIKKDTTLYFCDVTSNYCSLLDNEDVPIIKEKTYKDSTNYDAEFDELYSNAIRNAMLNRTEHTVDGTVIPSRIWDIIGIHNDKETTLTIDYSKAKFNLIDIKFKVEDYYKIVVNADKPSEKYYWNYDTNKYELLTVFDLGYLIETNFTYIGADGTEKPASLTEQDVSTIYGMFRNKQQPNNDAIAFNNMVIDTRTFTELPITTFTVKRMDYNYLSPSETKKNTLTERVLRQILIPKDKPSDETFYIDLLERIGASFKKVNKHKFIYLLTGTGDDGKGIILKILRTLHGALSVTVKPRQLTDDFFTVNLSDTNVILMDELDKNSFNNEVIGILKDITGRGETDSRLMHSQDTITAKDYGVVMIATNTVPSVLFNETAYWKRLVIIRLPNKFIEASADELKYNEYKADDDLYFKLEADKDGMEWLISESIKRYRERGNKFTVKQDGDADVTQWIYDGKSPLTMFIKKYVTETGNHEDRLSNREIKYAFIDYCNKKGFTVNDLKDIMTPLDLSKEIGYKLKNQFDSISESKTSKDGSKAYRGYGLRIDMNLDADTIKMELPLLEDEFFSE